MSGKNLPFYLTFSENQIQIIGGGFDKKRFKINSYSSINLPLDVIKSGRVVKPKLLAKTINELKIKARPKKIKSDFAAVSLSDRLVFSKFFSLPEIKEEELRGTIYFKVKDYLPFRASEMYIDWQAIIGENNKLNVNVVAVKREIINSYLRVFNVAGILPTRFEPESCSLARLASISEKGVSLVIYSKLEEAIFSFQEKGVVLFSKRSTVGGATTGENQLTGELEKAFSFWQENYGENKEIKKVFLAVEAIDEQEIKEFIGNRINSQIFKLPLPIVIPPQMPEGKIGQMIPLFGLSFARREEEIKKISLIPEKVKKRREDYKFKRKVKNLLKITSLMTALVVSLYFFVFLSIFFRLEKTKASLSGMEKIKFSKEQKSLEKKAVDLNEKINSLGKLLNRQENQLADFDNFVRLVPAGVRVTYFEYNASKAIIVVKGEASNRKSALALEESLSKMGEVKIPLSSFQESENLEFSAELKLQGENENK